jgi:hypothetical protein
MGIYIWRLLSPLVLTIPILLVAVGVSKNLAPSWMSLDLAISAYGAFGLALAIYVTTVIEPFYKRIMSGIIMFIGIVIAALFVHLSHLQVMKEGFTYSAANLQTIRVIAPIAILGVVSWLFSNHRNKNHE